MAKVLDKVFCIRWADHFYDKRLASKNEELALGLTSHIIEKYENMNILTSMCYMLSHG